jgi:DTW domain-containing protein YfiP
MAKRAVCPQCEFIRARCLCADLKLIANKVHIIVLQHPSEKKHSLGTVQLMKKSFQNITIWVGEDFSKNNELNLILNDPSHRIALLYPTKESMPQGLKTLPAITHLVIIDGTWKKSRKIYLESSNLHTLSAYLIESVGASEYRLRSSSEKNSLSSLEAVISALAIIENETDTNSLKETFKKMIDFQIEKMGQEKYKKNYLKS